MATKQLSSLDTGVHLQVLTGQDNYNAWVRDFKIVAKSEGVWGFYQGTEPILTKPERADYHIPTQKKKRMTADAEIVASDSSSSQAPTTPAALNTLETNITQYKLDSEEWKDNDKKVRRAQTLLPQWVDPAIRGNLEEHENPMNAWEYLKGKYS